MLCGALFLGTAALTSCSEDESYDVYGYDYTRAYFNVAKQTTNGMIVSTPVGLVTSLDAKVVVKTTSAATSDTKVALAIDSNVVSMKTGELVTEDTVDVKINEEVAKNMNSSDGYLAAVVITSADNGVRPSSNAAVTYIHLGYSESSVNDDATEWHAILVMCLLFGLVFRQQDVALIRVDSVRCLKVIHGIVVGNSAAKSQRLNLLLT